MEYKIEFKDGIFTETLKVKAHVATKQWKREEGEISVLCSKDNDFSEQLKDYFDDETLEAIYDFWDNQMLVADMEDFIMNYDV